MNLLFAFALALLVAVLISGLAKRSVLSTAVMFLMVGVALGGQMLGFIDVTPTDPLVVGLAVSALFSILFTDGMKLRLKDLVNRWHLPTRAVFLGMPLAFVFSAGLAKWMFDFSWAESCLLAAILTPTDPVLAAALAGRDDVPYRLRHLLNVESGVNDGLALPIVVLLLSISSHEEFHAVSTLTEVIAGLVVGVLVPAGAIWLERTRFFSAATEYEPLNAFAIGLTVFATCLMFHFNEFLAAFAAGITVASFSPEVRSSFEQFGELVAELLKLGALMVFGCLISFRFLSEISWQGYFFAFAMLFLIRPLSIAIAFVGSELDLRERAAAAWFGPKGFASVVYGILALQSQIERADQIFHLVAIVIVGSVILHSSTDVIVAKAFAGRTVSKGQTTPSRA